jgi:tetratricopeptide (TPR) repeat protein
LKAFELALLISRSPLISVTVDTSLIYNIAMAAYESRSWDKAVLYLTGLDKDSYSPEISLLLQKAYLAVGDSVSGVAVLNEGVEKYQYNQTLVLQLVDLYVASSRWVEAFVLMDSAIVHQADNHYFPWTRGLLYQNLEQYELAIEDLKHASKLAPEEVTIYYNLGICYYNMGVEIDKKALRIRSNMEYRAIRAEAKTSFEEAVVWFEKAYDANSRHQPTILKLYQLYSRLEMTQKRDAMKRKIN